MIDKVYKGRVTIVKVGKYYEIRIAGTVRALASTKKEATKKASRIRELQRK